VTQISASVTVHVHDIGHRIDGHLVLRPDLTKTADEQMAVFDAFVARARQRMRDRLAAVLAGTAGVWQHHHLPVASPPVTLGVDGVKLTADNVFLGYIPYMQGVLPRDEIVAQCQDLDPALGQEMLAAILQAPAEEKHQAAPPEPKA
jgi:hypothetical protein